MHASTLAFLFVWHATLGIVCDARSAVDSVATEDHTEVALAAGGSMSALAKSVGDAMIRRERLVSVVEHAQTAEEAGHPSVLVQEINVSKTSNSSEEKHTTTTYDPLGAEDGHWVSCGGHRAPRCRVCTILDPETGKPWPNEKDKGPDWCKGNCKWYEGECQAASNWNVDVKHNEGKQTNGRFSTTALPDLMNPNLTIGDQAIIDEAAKAGVAEADYLARQRAANAKRDEEEKKDKFNKFVYLSIMTAAVCLGCCACVSVVTVCRYGRNKPAKGGEAEANAQAEADPQAAKKKRGLLFYVLFGIVVFLVIAVVVMAVKKK
jgi:hypothetical protein